MLNHFRDHSDEFGPVDIWNNPEKETGSELIKPNPDSNQSTGRPILSEAKTSAQDTGRSV